ncbi:MAG TPA: class I SAM-dependent methyltransferase [Kofleriaceae bacterium]|nr:class I SAM-dependent methyltransferase [Kofleriaceae bacterium]
MRGFTDEPLLAVIAHVTAELEAAGASEIRVLDPALGRGHYTGERVVIDGVSYVHRAVAAWVELADRAGARVLVQRVEPPAIELRFERLADAPAWSGDGAEKYGTASGFARISKLEDPGFVLDVGDALARCALPAGARILCLGVNTGDEIALVRALAPDLAAAFVGIDHSASALAIARDRFPDAVFHEADVHVLAPLGLGRFDLVLALGTLQSAGIDDREVLRRVVQDHLATDGSVIVGVPNCRYLDGEVSSGARMKNFRQAELGLLIKDIAFYRKYLQQHHRQVFVTGTHYVLVTGIPAR